MSLKRDMVDQEYDQQSNSPSKFSNPDPKDNFIVSDLEIEEPIDPKDEEGIDQGNQEQELMVYVCLEGIDFNMMSCRVF